MPDLALERGVGGIVVGIDEVGRGPLAGPVIAAAVILDPARLPPRLLEKLDDSKVLSAKLRRELEAIIADCGRVGLGRAEVAEIDGINILQASLLAMRRAYLALGVAAGHALVDGNKAPDLPIPVTTVVGGDGKSLSIAAASVVAKVARDREMAELAQCFPAYGWDKNAGYGTALHMAALREFGPTIHHRRSFAPVAKALSRIN